MRSEPLPFGLQWADIDEPEHEPYCRDCGHVSCACEMNAEAADEEQSA